MSAWELLLAAASELALTETTRATTGVSVVKLGESFARKRKNVKSVASPTSSQIVSSPCSSGKGKRARSGRRRSSSKPVATEGLSDLADAAASTSSTSPTPAGSSPPPTEPSCTMTSSTTLKISLPHSPSKASKKTEAAPKVRKYAELRPKLATHNPGATCTMSSLAVSSSSSAGAPFGKAPAAKAFNKKVLPIASKRPTGGAQQQQQHHHHRQHLIAPNPFLISPTTAVQFRAAAAAAAAAAAVAAAAARSRAPPPTGGAAVSSASSSSSFQASKSAKTSTPASPVGVSALPPPMPPPMTAPLFPFWPASISAAATPSPGQQQMAMPSFLNPFIMGFPFVMPPAAPTKKG